MRIGQFRKLVTLSRSPQTSGDSDGYFELLNPSEWWCAIDPAGALGDGRTITHVITGRYRPDVSMDTRIVYADPVQNRNREFFVRGFRNVGERNIELSLDAEEVIP